MTSTPQARLQATRRRKLKLYVWEGAFGGYWAGIAIAVAYDVREARRLVAERYADKGRTRGNPSFDYAMTQVSVQPDVIPLDENTTPQA